MKLSQWNLCGWKQSINTTGMCYSFTVNNQSISLGDFYLQVSNSILDRLLTFEEKNPMFTRSIKLFLGRWWAFNSYNILQYILTFDVTVKTKSLQMWKAVTEVFLQVHWHFASYFCYFRLWILQWAKYVFCPHTRYTEFGGREHHANFPLKTVVCTGARHNFYNLLAGTSTARETRRLIVWVMVGAFLIHF